MEVYNDFYEIIIFPAYPEQVETICNWMNTNINRISYEASFIVPEIIEILVYQEDGIRIIQEELELIHKWCIEHQMTMKLVYHQSDDIKNQII